MNGIAKILAVIIIILIAAVIFFLSGNKEVKTVKTSQFAFVSENAGRSPYTGPQTNNARLLFGESPGPGCGRQIIMTAPVLDSNGNLYFGTSEGSLISIAPNGREKWRFTLPDAYPRNNCGGEDGEKGSISDHNIGFMPAFDGTNVYFGTSGIGNAKRIYALDTNGKELWRFDIDGPLRSHIKISISGRIYFTTLTTLYSLNQKGADSKTYSISERSKMPALWKERVYVCSGEHLVALDQNLKKIWELDTETDANLNNCKPAVNPDTGTVYFVANNRDSNEYKMFAVSSSGRLLWSTDVFWTEATPAIAKDGTVYVSAVDLSVNTEIKLTSSEGRGNGNLIAVNPDGSVRWSFNIPPQLVCNKGEEDCPSADIYTAATSIDGPPTIGADGAIYFGTDAQRYFALNPDRTIKWIFKGGDEWDNPAMIAPDGTLYTGPRGLVHGGLYAFSDSIETGNNVSGRNGNESNYYCSIGRETGTVCSSRELCSSGEWINECCIGGSCEGVIASEADEPNPNTENTQIQLNQPCTIGNEKGNTCNSKESCSSGEFIQGCCISGMCSG